MEQLRRAFVRKARILMARQYFFPFAVACRDAPHGLRRLGLSLPGYG